VNKRTAAALALAGACLLAGAVIGFAWHAPGRASTWNDFRTWVTAVAVIAGVTVAVVQLGLNRRQLASQQDVIAADVQLRQRAQAEKVDLAWAGIWKPPPQWAHIFTGHETGSNVRVTNSSGRPIRDVICELRPPDSTTPIRAEEWNLWAPATPGQDILVGVGTRDTPGWRIDLISGLRNIRTAVSGENDLDSAVASGPWRCPGLWS
jgi:hypothetical protein